VYPWIQPQTTLSNITVTFPFIKFKDSMHLRFKLVFSKNIQLNEIKYRNIAKSIKKLPILNMLYQVVYESHTKKYGGEKRKKISLPSVLPMHSAKLIFCRVPDGWHSANIDGSGRRVWARFFVECHRLPSVRHSAK
jgi:hypothetical protein